MITVRYEPEVSVSVIPAGSFGAAKQRRYSRMRVPSGDAFGTPSMQLGSDGKLRSCSGLPAYHASLENA